MSKLASMDLPKAKDGALGLSYPMLARSNYTAWSIKMKVFMQVQGVWDAIETDDPKAKVETRKDKVALTLIYQGSLRICCCQWRRKRRPKRLGRPSKPCALEPTELKKQRCKL